MLSVKNGSMGELENQLGVSLCYWIDECDWLIRIAESH